MLDSEWAGWLADGHDEINEIVQKIWEHSGESIYV